MSDDAAKIAELLDAERKRADRAAKPEEMPEQRERRLARDRWHKNVESIWLYAHLLEADELEWFAAVTEASKARGTRKVSTWSGGTRRVARATTADDAIRLDKLKSVLWERHWKRDIQRSREDRRKVATALRGLGRPVPAWFAWTEDITP
jgi:hypothetical protein